MVPVSDRVSELYMMDSIRKSLEIYLYEWVPDEWSLDGGYYALLAPNSTELATEIAPTITDDQILSESMNYKEGLLEGEVLKFGSLVAKELSLQRIYNGVSYSKKVCKAVLALYDEDGETLVNRITLFDGYVAEDKFQDNGFIKDMTLRSNLAAFLDWNIGSDGSGNLTAFMEPGPSAYSFDGSTVADYFDFVGMATRCFINIPYDSAERRLRFPSPTGRYNSILDMPIAMSGAEAPLTASAALSGLAELCGAFLRESKMIVLDDYPEEELPYAFDVYSTWLTSFASSTLELIRVDTYVRQMYPADDLYPADMLFPLYSGSLLNGAFNTGTFVIPWYISATWSEEDLVNYIRAECYIGSELKASTGVDGGNSYQIKDNAALRKSPDGTNNCYAEAVASVLAMCNQNNYSIGTLQHLWAPFVEPGDNIVLLYENKVIVMPVFSCQVQGINLLRATTDCRAQAS